MNEFIISPRVKGRFKFIAVREDGTERPLTGWIDNLILDSGLNMLGTSDVLGSCQVGTSNTAPVANQTTLQGYLAGTSSIQEVNYGAQSTTPYFGWKTVRYRFDAGVATGNISEVGVGPQRTVGTTLFARALILDVGGTPVTISVLANEILDVVYELRLYPPLVDGSGVVTISGVNYTVTWRACRVTDAILWGYYIGSMASLNPNGNNNHAVYNGVIGAITDSPSGVSDARPIGNLAYSNNSLQRDGSVFLGLDMGNVAGGVSATSFSSTLGAYQFSFSPVLPKDNTKTLALTYRIAWNRYP